MSVLGRTLLAAAAGALAVGAAAPAMAAPTAAGTSGTVVVVHGLRGLVADVSVDGKQVLTDFAPERVTDPLTLPAGAHAVVVRKTRQTADLLTTKLNVTGGVQTTAAVGLSTTGAPALMPFREQQVRIPAGAARLLVRNLAAAPPVAVSVDGVALTGKLANAHQLGRSVKAGSHTISVGGSAVPTQQVTLTAGRTTVMYLTGSARQQTLSWIGQVLPTASSPLSGGKLSKISTGDSGLLPGSRDSGRGATLPAAVVVLAGSGRLLAGLRRRRRSA